MRFSDDGYSDCQTCDGNRVIRYTGRLDLIEVCPECKGHGRFDWIEVAMKRPKKEDAHLEVHIAQRNIQILMRMIQDEAMKCGQRVHVDIKHIPAEEHYYGMKHPIIRSKY